MMAVFSSRSVYPVFTTLLFLLLPFEDRAQAQSAKDEIAVVVNSRVPAKEISLSKLRQMAMGEQHQWDRGGPVYLLVPAPGTPGCATVLAQIYEMSESQYKKYWLEKIFRGEAAAEPTRFFAAGTIYSGIDSLPGAMAFIDAQAVRPGLKVLKVDGKLPGQPGYPLHQ